MLVIYGLLLVALIFSVIMLLVYQKKHGAISERKTLTKTPDAAKTNEGAIGRGLSIVPVAGVAVWEPIMMKMCIGLPGQKPNAKKMLINTMLKIPGNISLQQKLCDVLIRS